MVFGIFAAIGSAISSFVGTVGSAIVGIGSQIASAISSALPSIGSTISSWVDKLSTCLGSIVEAVITAVEVVGKLLGIIPQEMSVEELGARAMDNPELEADDFETYDEYIKALVEAEFDKEIIEKATDGEKAAFALGGTVISSIATEEKLRMSIPIDFWVNCTKGNMSGENMLDLLNSLKANNISDAGSFSEFLQGEEIEDSEQMSDIEAAISDYESKDAVQPISDVIANIENSK